MGPAILLSSSLSSTSWISSCSSANLLADWNCVLRLVEGWFASLLVEGRFGGRFVELRVGDGDLEFGIEVSFCRGSGGGSGLLRGEGDRDMWGGSSAAELGT